VEALNPPSEVDGSQVAVGFIVGFLLYLGIFGGGMAVAQGVVEEKSSRSDPVTEPSTISFGPPRVFMRMRPPTIRAVMMAVVIIADLERR